MTDARIASAWTDVSDLERARLADARLQLHWAAQTVSAVAHTHVDPRDDDSHTNLGWDSSFSGLVSRELSGSALRSGIRLNDLSLAVLDADGSERETLTLAGQTLDAAYEWMAEALERHSNGTVTGQLKRRDYEMPAHAVSSGAVFTATDEEALAEISRWFGNAATVIDIVANEEAHASPVRCWPHHFDIATLISLDPDKGGEEARSIGVGMTPGDLSYAEPYFYVTPWPYPKDVSPPGLDAGHWRTEGWFGAVITQSDLIAHGAQGQAIGAFLRSAVAGSRTLLA